MEYCVASVWEDGKAMLEEHLISGFTDAIAQEEHWEQAQSATDKMLVETRVFLIGLHGAFSSTLQGQRGLEVAVLILWPDRSRYHVAVQAGSA